MSILDYIRVIPDYPKPGIDFYDLNSLFSSPAWNYYIEQLANECERKHCHLTNIAGLESRGFVVGAALSHAMSLPFTMIRKKGAKYPGDLIEEPYELEYGSDTLVLQEGIFGHTSRVLIADDLIATGGSIQAAKKLVEKSGAKVVGYVTILNLTQINSLDNVIALRHIS